MKKIGKKEKEKIYQAFLEQEEKYESEKTKREQKFNQQINNLRTFQLISEPTAKKLSSHQRSYSSSYTVETDDRIIFSSSPQPLDFKNELKRKGYGEKSGFIGSGFTNTPQANTPLNEETDPFETSLVEEENDLTEPKQRKHFSFPLLNNNYQILIDEIANTGGVQEQLQRENEALKENQIHLEADYKLLFDEKVENERRLQEFNEKEQS